MTEDHRTVQFTKKTSDFNEKFYDLYCQKSFTDVTLSAEAQFIHAHKVVLAVASSWFEDLFKLLHDKHPVIVLKDTTLQQLHSIIEFIYTGKTEIPKSDVESFKSSLKSLRISFDEVESSTEQVNITIKEEPVSDEEVVIRRAIEKPKIKVQVNQLKISNVSSIPAIRIRSPSSINAEKEEKLPKTLKIVQRLPTVQPSVNETKIQEISKRLSKAILIRKVKKSDGSFLSERSPIKVIQGVKIQKILPKPGTIKMERPIMRCSFCNKAFSVNKRKNAHEKFCFKNPARPSSQCPYCPMVLCNPAYIQTHARKVHGISIEMSDIASNGVVMAGGSGGEASMSN